MAKIADPASRAHAHAPASRQPKDVGLDANALRSIDLAKLIGTHDSNNDKKMSVGEMQAALLAGLENVLPQHTANGEAKWDTLSREYSRHRQELSDKVDTGWDAHLEETEMSPPDGAIPDYAWGQALQDAIPPPKPSDAMTPDEERAHGDFVLDQINEFAAMDTNRDGHLSKEEFMAYHTVLTNAKWAFAKADVDGDGQLTIAEMTQMQELLGENDPIVQHLLASAQKEL